jgi:archaemetzincin
LSILPKSHTALHILISPYGDFEKRFFNTVSKEIHLTFGYQTQIKSLLQGLDFAHDPDRDQYHSTPILEKLSQKAPPDAIRVLAVVQVDLFIPILTHVFGEAQLGGRACIVSTRRLTDNLPVLDSGKFYVVRTVKEAIHELGHTFNLRHCPDEKCIMHYCRSLVDVDRKSDQLCRYCKILVADEISRNR